MQADSPIGKEPKPTSEEKEKPKVEKIVTGEVKQKPKTIGYRFKRIFFGGDFKLAGNFVMADIILPMLRDLFVNGVARSSQAFAESLVYGESRRHAAPRPYRGVQEYRGVNYNRFFDPRDQRPEIMPPGPVARIPDQRGSGHRVDRRNVENILLYNREDANNLVEGMYNMLSQYDVVALSDVYIMIGKETSYIDEHWGWTDLRGTEVRQSGNGWLVVLPPVESI